MCSATPLLQNGETRPFEFILVQTHCHTHNTPCRLSSEFFPWGNVHYQLRELPDYEEIKAALAAAGEYARETGQRLTSHPSEYVKLAGQSEELVEKSLADLELHSEVGLCSFPGFWFWFCFSSNAKRMKAHDRLHSGEGFLGVYFYLWVFVDSSSNAKEACEG